MLYINAVCLKKSFCKLQGKKKYTEENDELAESRSRRFKQRERISELVLVGSRDKDRHA